MSEELYQQALDEVESGEYSRGLWAKCYAEADGDEAKTRAGYIRDRVAQLGGEVNKTTTDDSKSLARRIKNIETLKSCIAVLGVYMTVFFMVVYMRYYFNIWISMSYNKTTLIITTFASFWIAKRLSGFNNLNPFINLACLMLVPFGWIPLFLVPAATGLENVE